jgi:Potassium-transporting ATPase A subunit
MILGRYVPLLAALALAGSVATKTVAPDSAGTLRTDGPTFVVLLVGVIVLTSGMMVLPAPRARPDRRGARVGGARGAKPTLRASLSARDRRAVG